MFNLPPGLLAVQRPIIHLKFPTLSQNPDLFHGIFTRMGGVSSRPFHSLNTSYSVGDRPQNVTANLERIKTTAGARSLQFMIQQHGTRIVVLRRDHSSETAAPPSADAMITDRPRVALMVKQADCQAVILFDPVKRVVANVHCGWRGNVQNILGKTVERMQREFGCRGTDILAAIGPSLGPCCAEFAEHEEIFPKDFSHFMVRENFFDLWAVSTQQLMESGIPKANVELAQACTRCRTDLFFSYRGERGHTGRTATIAMLT